ncbi:DUF4286 family protein [Sneathiella aquimaris]|uniref:DUF4286 family protein n=1 Tax=Sneathiella aquimaris TaxID=2599305 RepID=UPI00146C0D2D|nr:DUF4286 family protein [Sneathiella aquimaris]
MHSISNNLLVVRVKVDPDVESEWNTWYNKVHLPEISECPGFLSASRYMSEDESGRLYLTVYELEHANAAESTEFNARRGWAHFSDKVHANVHTFKKISEGKM